MTRNAAEAPCAVELYPQSYSPPEYRGLSPGSGVPIIPSVEQTCSCPAAGCLADAAACQAPCAVDCHQVPCADRYSQSYSPPEYRGLSPGSEVPIEPFDEHNLSCLATGCQTDAATSQVPCAVEQVPCAVDCHQKSYCAPQYRGLRSGSEVPILPVGVQSSSLSGAGCEIRDDADLAPDLSAVLSGMTTQAASLPLCHMEYKEDTRGIWRWKLVVRAPGIAKDKLFPRDGNQPGKPWRIDVGQRQSPLRWGAALGDAADHHGSTI